MKKNTKNNLNILKIKTNQNENQNKSKNNQNKMEKKENYQLKKAGDTHLSFREKEGSLEIIQNTVQYEKWSKKGGVEGATSEKILLTLNRDVYEALKNWINVSKKDKQIDYRDRTYLDKRKTLRQLSVKDEIKNYIDIVSDDVWDRIKIFNVGRYDFIKSIIDLDDINFYSTIKTLLIDGFLAYEIIYNEEQNKITGLNPIDPISLIVKPDPDNDNKFSWIQYPDNDSMRRVLTNDQIIYFSYSRGAEYYHISYVEELKESYEKFKMAESAHLYVTVATGAKGDMDLDSVKWLEKNMNRTSKIPNDKLSFEVYQYIEKSNDKYEKFLTRISDIFKIKMFDKLLDIKNKIEK